MIERDVVEVSGVRVRSLTAGEQIDLEAAMSKAGGDIRKLIVAQLHAYVCDESGKPTLTAEQALEMVETRKMTFVRAVLEKAGELNKFDPETIRGN